MRLLQVGRPTDSSADKSPLQQSATFSLLQVLDVQTSRDICFARGGQRRAALIGSLSAIVNADGPDRYVLSYALEALRRLSDAGDEAARQRYYDALEVSRWCPRTTALSLY